MTTSTSVVTEVTASDAVNPAHTATELADVVAVATTTAVATSDQPATTSTAPTATPNQLARKLLKKLQTEFSVFDEHLPLAIGIDKQLQKKMPELDRKVLRIALGIHTNSVRYLFNAAKAQKRVDLEGKEVDAITEEHRTHASGILRERSKKNADARKLKANAERIQKQEAEAERQRQDKLNQLAAKFART
ncbi:ProQ/FinO family protein [Undibacterium sp. RTI2.1]|uniref:ProQ/FinO family protein n=1 Tax=unclassified Undibacterium TaxID=2630295 RepID=UPI002AB5A3FA|nr:MULTISPECIES: ProQ/FinO family protein [unclassified Undibacterium]MDY7537355.1 ProQ/FinO family protein [Undibacterium sp. 5I1]MEB0033212.1 ProQ/FinO family protein [Undibacterium sp. RTI2.1]MEB0119010.1 ProQ/FinO family protein [Undibacterium sp. RTI2.2]MEB0233247.1 ProQ/FinO family protein [Undibacterium sp. 10I3]MEB0259876.1 ProQ/FinO family protein [Undibacterium sp. 5I1]